MKITGALIKEQNVTFAIVLVKPHAMNSNSTASETIKSFEPIFPDVPIVLASQDSRGQFHYRGRHDLVKFLASIHASQIPWREYTFS